MDIFSHYDNTAVADIKNKRVVSKIYFPELNN